MKSLYAAKYFGGAAIRRDVWPDACLYSSSMMDKIAKRRRKGGSRKEEKYYS